MASFKKLIKRHGRTAAGFAVGGPVGAAVGKATTPRPGPPGDAELYAQLGGTGPGDVPLDEFGYPTAGMLPAGRIAPQVQMQANALIAKRRQEMISRAGATFNQGYAMLGEYRPGGLAQVQSGLLGQQAQTLVQGAQMLEEPNLMWYADRDADMKARSAARRAGYMNIAGTIIGAAAGAALGPGGAIAGAALGNRATQPGPAQQSTDPGQGALPASEMGGYQTPVVGSGQITGIGGQPGPLDEPSKLQGTGGYGPRAATLGGPPSVEGPPTGAPPGGKQAPSGGQGTAQAGMQQQAGGQNGAGGGMAPQAQSGGQMRVAAAAPAAAQLGVQPEMVLTQLYDMDPDLIDEGWIDQSLGRLRAMRAMDPVPSFG